VLGIKVLLRAGACRPREELARSFTSPPQPDLDHALLFALCSLSPVEVAKRLKTLLEASVD
jgi:hypothetical protein